VSNTKKTQVSAQKIMKQTLELKVEDLYVSQEQYLKEFWDNCAVEVFGDQDLNMALYYNLYQLIRGEQLWVRSVLCIIHLDQLSIISAEMLPILLAQYNLKWAVNGVELLKEQGMEKELVLKTGIIGEELEEFQKASQNMYLLYDDKLGINLQDDSFL
jgi:trehalose/maltose hydrolase-like predicted phosphorylase